MSHHSCLCAPSLRCLSCLGEYGLNLVQVLSFPFCLPKSRDEIFLRRGELSQPRKKKKKEKNPTPGPPVSLPFPHFSLFCSAPHRTRRRRRPFSRHVPVILVPRARPYPHRRRQPYPPPLSCSPFPPRLPRARAEQSCPVAAPTIPAAPRPDSARQSLPRLVLHLP